MPLFGFLQGKHPLASYQATMLFPRDNSRSSPVWIFHSIHAVNQSPSTSGVEEFHQPWMVFEERN